MTPVARITQQDRDLIVYPLVGKLPEIGALGSWREDMKAWRVPATLMNLRWLRQMLLNEVVEEGVEVRETWARDAEYDERLFGFQRDGVARLLGDPRGQILCASPGLGKTAMAIVAAEYAVPDGDQIVVVAPAPLLATWAREIARWAMGDAKTYILHGKTEHDWSEVQAARWIVTSWDTVARHQDWFFGWWPLWIFDESVLAKNRHSQRAKAVGGGKQKKDGKVVKQWENLRKHIGRVWMLSGAPITRHADDLWKQLNLIDPRSFRSYWRFAERYCRVEETPWAKVVSGTRRDQDAVKDNEDLICVINQEDVLDLPEYLFETIHVTLGPKQRRAFEDMKHDFIALLDSGEELDAQTVMAQLVYLQQITSYWQGESAKHDMAEMIVRSPDYPGPHLMWTHWKEGAAALADRLGSIVRVGHVDGDVSRKIKDATIEDYKAGRLDCLVMSMGVGKFGHTLTNTQTITYVDKTFAADDYFQSLRRVRRIGLTHRPLVVSLFADDTTDELLGENLEVKMDAISRVTRANLLELLRGIGR